MYVHIYNFDEDKYCEVHKLENNVNTWIKNVKTFIKYNHMLC